MMGQSEEDLHAPSCEIDEQPLKDQDRQSSSNENLTEINFMQENVKGKTKSRSVDRHKIYDKGMKTDQRRIKMENDNQIYLNKIELGKRIAGIMVKDSIPEGSLSPAHKEALDLYIKQKPWMDIQSVKLRPWQQQLLNIIEVPSIREVIWVVGEKGNEGKTWFQQYLETAYGYSRVVQLDLKIGTTILVDVLKERSLSSADIFLFNSPLSCKRKQSNYFIVESIKDGRVSSAKNETIRCKTPNVVAVFSNFMPQWEKLTMDRWKVFRIENDELIIDRQNDEI